MPHFAQESLLRATAKDSLDSQEYLDALANGRKFSREDGIDKALNDNAPGADKQPSIRCAISDQGVEQAHWMVRRSGYCVPRRCA